jgi:hypothetical protein
MFYIMCGEMSLEDSLRRVLETGRDWQRVSVKGAPGVFVVKAPAYRGRPASLMVEINPVGADGAPKKRRGLMLRSLEELSEFRKILQNERIDEVLTALEKINPRQEGGEGELEI